FNIKETRLLHIAIPSINAEEIESYRRPQNQGVFRTLHLPSRLLNERGLPVSMEASRWILFEQ
ncbi:hypothetical protein, partial [Acetobacter musti]|uniref:hypothetical protein n=1 Tax=Acetobacter musti TaxID=864732 RepID=UPI001A7E53E5